MLIEILPGQYTVLYIWPYTFSRSQWVFIVWLTPYVLLGILQSKSDTCGYTSCQSKKRYLKHCNVSRGDFNNLKYCMVADLIDFSLKGHSLILKLQVASLQCFKRGITMSNGIRWFARTRSYTPTKFVYVSQQCAVFAVRHARWVSSKLTCGVDVLEPFTKPFSWRKPPVVRKLAWRTSNCGVK
jgi:hypothetical protein